MRVQRGMPGLRSSDHILQTIAAELAKKLAGVFAAETVERYVFESYTTLARTVKIDDRAETTLVEARRIRDEIDAHVQALLADLTSDR